MSVTFGTPTATNIAGTSSQALYVTVTSGQQLIVCVASLTSQTISITDGFSTHYTWTLLKQGTNGTGEKVAIFIGQGGAGASGTITVTLGSATYFSFAVIPVTGASTASGTGVIDVSGFISSSAPSISLSLTPNNAGEGAVFCYSNSATALTTYPSSPFANSFMGISGNNFYCASTYQSPTSGSSLTATYGTGSSSAQSVAGVILLAASSGYTVTFNANGGSGTMSPETDSTATALTLNTFTRTGYTFAHWNTAADNSGTSYADGASYPFTASVTLYAIWAAIPFGFFTYFMM